jgi:hypothetical protein
MRVKLLNCLGLVMLFSLAACNGTTPEPSGIGAVATDTLQPIVSLTPRNTATPVPSRTALPTFTFTPSNTPITPTPSRTPTPSATPPVTGIVASLNTVNVREGPGVNFSAIEALVPGTGIVIIASSEDGRWLNIRLESGEEGWISTDLIRINPTPTSFPTLTPSPNLTQLAQSNLPTALFSQGATATPPPQVTTAASATGAPSTASVGLPTVPGLPSIDTTAISLTATALALPTASPTFTPIPLQSATPDGVFVGITFTPGPGAAGTLPANPGTATGDVGALCDNTGFGVPRPRNISTRTQVDIYWAWFASTEQQVNDHAGAVTYEITVNGEPLTDWNNFGFPVRREGNQYVKYWYVPIGTLPAGETRITYRATWSRPIFDGSRNYGPGTDNPEELGGCTFVVSP